MPKRKDIDSILIIGAGPIVIGQACEFDYSGAQACKALKEDGYRVILINSNPATIMTDPSMSDATYIEPIHWETIEKIIEKEKPDALLPTMGGQTALNAALDLDSRGILKKHNVEMIGATKEAIDKAEDRELFAASMERIGLKVPESGLAHNLEEANDLLERIGFPCVLRPNFTMGGSGGGIAYNNEEFEEICNRGLELSPTSEIFIDKFLGGWKEYEMEVVRDKNDNCIIVCSIENIDPMGVHTGDSITVAPAQTLTDKEFQIMRNASLDILREIGVETGGSNVQFTVNPEDGEMLIIEMNPRVSRSSALASKATGFPIAKVAAKLAVGYTLDELSNDITGGVIPASFEPSIDYVVTKIPRFNFEKFIQTEPVLSTQMKSVGEVMAIGRTFQESLQKAIRGLETGRDGLNEIFNYKDEVEILNQKISTPSPDRLWYVGDAFRAGLSVEEVFSHSKIDQWFLVQINDLIEEEKNLLKKTLKDLDNETLHKLKSKGFSDSRIAFLLNVDESKSKDIIESLEEEDREESTKFGYDFINTTPTNVSATSDLPVPNDYKISLNDTFRVILTGTKKSIFTMPVQLDGTVLFPELGSISVAGDTFSDVKKKFKNLINTSYVGVDIDISLSDLSAKKISIVGAVYTPGTYLVNPFTTISNALAYAGGVQEFGSLRNIELVKPSGDRYSFDLYDLLIKGDRSNDINVSAGDIVVVNGTSKFVEINGSVIRPKIYEYTNKDSYQDLINFSLGFSSGAEPNNVTSTLEDNSRIYNSEANISEKVGNNNLLELYVGSKVTRNDRSLFVTGSGVTSGYFAISGTKFSEILSKLNFSDDIYPFYAVYEQEKDLGLSKISTAFSLADPATYEDLAVTKNSVIFFYDRNYILNVINQFNPDILVESTNLQELSDIDPVLESDISQVFISQKSFRLPLKGRFTPKQLHLFFGASDDVDLSKVSIITTESSSSNAYDLVVNAEDIVAISLPPIKQNLIEVEIQGEIANPGLYVISSSTNLNELYTLAGGFRDNSFEGGILLYREEVKQKQIKAIKEAKSILTDSVIQKSSSVSERGLVDIDAILKLADLVEPNGRIAGEFAPNSETAKEFLLKDGDLINVPSKSIEVTVQGEVLNSSSFIYDDDYDYNDYINASGGFTDSADRKALFIIKANGQSVAIGRNIFGSNKYAIEPGDTIVVPRNLDQLEALPMISMATKIISDIAFSAASLNAIQN